MILLLLENIGESFCKIYKKNFEHDDITDIYRDNIKEVIEQCENDCYVLREKFTNFRSIIKEKFDVDITTQLNIFSTA